MSDPFPAHILQAAQSLQQGGIVGHEAEGVWGLACDPNNAGAVERLLRLKGRAPSKGFILIAAHANMLALWLEPLPIDRRAIIKTSWPGPVTWIVPNDGHSPPWIQGEQNTLAVRVPDHAQMQNLSLAFGAPLISTSANPSGQPPALCQIDLCRYFPGLLDYVLPSANGKTAKLSGKASTIRHALTLATLRP